MKKAQAEIIGLVLIVLLLGIGFLLYIKFSYGNDATPKSAYESTSLGQSFVNSLAKSELNWCGKDVSVEAIVKSIATGGETCAKAGEPTQEAALKEYLEKEVLLKTFDEWGVNYRLSIMRPGTNPSLVSTSGLPQITNSKIILDAEKCNDKMNRARATYPIVLAPNPGRVEIWFEQCE